MTRLDEIKFEKNGLHIGQKREDGKFTYYEKNGFQYEIAKCHSSFYFECNIRKIGETKWTKLCTRANADTCVSKIINYIKENS